ncbi:MAG: hypothetical protein H8E98_04475 [Bacteroidetes bacterium]|nr:hypothetical protein [Bacteroidota bacterium]
MRKDILSSDEKKDKIKLVKSFLRKSESYPDFVEFNEAWESLRTDFTSNPMYRGMDITFDTYMGMSGVETRMFYVLNKLSLLLIESQIEKM